MRGATNRLKQTLRRTMRKLERADRRERWNPIVMPTTIIWKAVPSGKLIVRKARKASP